MNPFPTMTPPRSVPAVRILPLDQLCLGLSVVLAGLLVVWPYPLHGQDNASEPSEVFRDCPTCPEMVIVPPGSFLMGSPETEAGRDPDEGPQRRVTLSAPFAIGRYEVTFDEWQSCLNDKGCDWYLPDEQGWGFGRRPVVQVSWQDAQNFVVWLRQKTGKPYRLPSEAEWEYAARAGTATPFWTGTMVTSDQANIHQHIKGRPTLNETAPDPTRLYRGRTVEVDAPLFRPNPFGLFHTTGNVWEWVEDCYSDSYLGAPSDGRPRRWEGCPNRVLRGGSWYEGPAQQRSAVRFIGSPGMQLNTFGFRVTRDLDDRRQ